jgi:hypothetical protein
MRTVETPNRSRTLLASVVSVIVVIFSPIFMNGCATTPPAPTTNPESATSGPSSGSPSDASSSSSGALPAAAAPTPVPGSPPVVPTWTANQLAANGPIPSDTGEILAESDFFDPLPSGALITPGYGGRFYFLTTNGFMVLQVLPAAASART